MPLENGETLLPIPEILEIPKRLGPLEISEPENAKHDEPEFTAFSLI